MPKFKYPNNYDDDFINAFKKVLDYLNEMGYTYEESLQTAKEILDEAKQTNDMNKAVDERLDNIIADSGTSSTEVVDARGSHTVLSERLNSVDSKVKDRMEKSVLPLYAKDYKVHPYNTPTQNREFLQQAVEDAEAQGRPLVLPFVPDGEWVSIDGPIVVGNGNVEIYGYGRNTRIRQTVFPNPIFDVTAPNVAIDGFYAHSTSFDASGASSASTTYRGHLLKSYHGAVTVYADNVTVKNVKGDNLIEVVLVYAWDVATDQIREPLKNVKVENLECSNVDFGLLVKGVENFFFEKITGSYKMMPGSSTPPHLVYFVESENPNINVNGGNCNAIDGVGGQAYQFKGMVQSNVYNLVAHNCDGIANFMLNESLKVKGLESYGDNYTDQVSSSLETQSENNGLVIEDIKIEMAGNGKPIRIGKDTSNSTIKYIYVKSNHTAYDVVGSSYDVDIQGTNNKAINVEVENIGPVQWTAGVGIWDGVGNEISNPKTKGNIFSTQIRKGDNHILSDYDVEKMLPIRQRSIAVATLATSPKFFPKQKNAYGIADQDRLIAFERCDFPANNTGWIGRTSSGHLWEQARGEFHIKNKRIYSHIGSAVAYVDVGESDVDVSAGIAPQDREALAIRVIDADNYLFARINNQSNTVELYKMDGGTATLLDSTSKTIQTGRRYVLRVQTFGDAIDVFVNNELLVSHTLSSADMKKYGTSTSHGIRTNTSPSGYFDNIEWRKLD